MGNDELLADLAREVAATGKIAAATSAHVDHLRHSTDSAWKKLDSLERKIDDSLTNLLAGLPCDERLKECAARFSAIELSQGIATVRIAGLITAAFVVLQVLVWLGQWGFTKVTASMIGVGP